jgi:DNA-binding protein HU-beta
VNSVIFKEGIPMTTAELVSLMAKESNIPKKSAVAVLKSLVQAVNQTLHKGGEIRVADLGTFKVMERKARAGVNPRTGAKIQIPATKAPVFRPAQALREAAKEAGKKTGKKSK